MRPVACLAPWAIPAWQRRGGAAAAGPQCPRHRWWRCCRGMLPWMAPVCRSSSCCGCWSPWSRVCPRTHQLVTSVASSAAPAVHAGAASAGVSVLGSVASLLAACSCLHGRWTHSLQPVESLSCETLMALELELVVVVEVVVAALGLGEHARHQAAAAAVGRRQLPAVTCCWHGPRRWGPHSNARRVDRGAWARGPMSAEHASSPLEMKLPWGSSRSMSLTQAHNQVSTATTQRQQLTRNHVHWCLPACGYLPWRPRCPCSYHLAVAQ